MQRPLLLYIHGFLSSPQSAKAEATRRYLYDSAAAIDCLVPALPNYPGQALAVLCEQVEASLAQGPRPLGLIGSSLGGFFATVLAERYELPAVLVNPAVQPHELVAEILGVEQCNPYSGQRFTLDASDQRELQAMEVAELADPARYWVLLQTGDETLDYRRAAARYRDCRLTVEPGGDHHFQGFERHLPEILKFLQLQAWEHSGRTPQV